MKILYSIVGIILIIAGAVGAYYLRNIFSSGEADTIDSLTIILFSAMIPIIFGLLFLTIPKSRMNKVTHMSLWGMLLTCALIVLAIICSQLSPEAGLLIVPLFTILVGVSFVVSFGLLVVGRFKSPTSI